MSRQHIVKGGFALPTVLIASVVMLTILATSVTSVVAVRNSLKVQYYEQLAKLAGEAGVAYAKACLAGNGNVPLWTDAKPLTPGSDCSGNESGCPSDPKCSVLSDENLRSSFAVKLPKLDTSGKALAIPNSGYVELLRSSNGAVWRTYYQPSVQAAVVPDLCSGAAESGLGWTNAVATSTQDSIPDASLATTISVANASISAGSIYLRKDFTVTSPGSYYISTHTPVSLNKAEVYIDGVYASTAQGSLSSAVRTLTAGCHTMTIKLTNETLAVRQSRVTAAVQKLNSAPIAYTDTSWRVSSGNTVHFSEAQYYASPSAWTAVKETDGGAITPAAWSSATGDPQAMFIISSCDTSCPANQSTYFRDGRDIVLTSPATVDVFAACDDNCVVYIDGQPIITHAPWSNIATRTVDLSEGVHHVGVRLTNGGTAAGPSKFSVTVKDSSSGTVLTRSDSRWLTSNNTWVSGATTGNDPRSYEDNFRPSPKEIADTPTLDVLIVGGGGGGGGNCTTCGGAGGGGGGGVRVVEGIEATVGSSAITVGAGGSAGAGGASRSNGGSGGSSQFRAGYVAYGGGGGGSQLGTPGLNGASGGGGSGGGTPAPGAGGSGINGQGSRGGAGRDATSGNYNGGGGGGAAGYGLPGTQPVTGDGGPGVITYLFGSPMTVGSGGSAGSYSTYAVGKADKGGGSGASQNINNGIGYPGTANTGGGGGGGNGQTRGGSGGAGGSGIVVVRYRTGTVTATGGTITYVTIGGIQYTVHTFKTVGSATFTITSVKPY